MTAAVRWEINETLQKLVTNVCIDIAVFIFKAIQSCLELIANKPSPTEQGKPFILFKLAFISI